MAKQHFKGNTGNTWGRRICEKQKLQLGIYIGKRRFEQLYTLKRREGGKYPIRNIFPIMDTGVCATSGTQVQPMAATSPIRRCWHLKDLPFACCGRSCTTEGITNVIPLSDCRHTRFAEKYVIG